MMIFSKFLKDVKLKKKKLTFLNTHKKYFNVLETLSNVLFVLP